MDNRELKDILQSVITEALKPIQEEMKTMNTRIGSLESGQSELHQITSAIRDRQEETDAKLEALSMDVNKIQGNTVRIEEKINEDLVDIHGDVRFLSHRIVALEMDVDKLKNK
ncbi:hypothetical protein [Paenibacillus glacialis]|uniref:Uncharacterized protein n=1 Tax=Paenibacillus glacialis TaxID=494026 RepID=A0A168DG37_9BACL|nr:hypothetical protein [Paenibacillus glacialis]OAB34166.1 hypothetical protein PGLA_25055 [Paenibacillus glacialis]